jgi:hypothetical protein
MIIADMPFEPFLNLLRTSAKKLNYHLIAILVAREADCRWAFDQLEKDWASLHDVTGKKVIFVTVDGEDHTPISDRDYQISLKEGVGTIRDNYGLIAFSKSCKLLNDIKDPNLDESSPAYQWAKLPNEAFVNRHIRSKPRPKGWGDSQSLGVSSILNSLKGVSESQVPCLYLELTYCGYGFVLPIANDPPDGFSFYKGFKKLLIDSDVSFANIKEYSAFLQKEGDNPRSSKAANSISWVNEWVESQSKLPEQIRSFILMALEGKASDKDVYKVISPMRSELDGHTFNTLRGHLNRITSNPQYIRLSQGKAFVAVKLSEECHSFEQATRRIFMEHESGVNMNRLQKPAASVISILFLAADPTNASRLRLGEEFREIDEQLRLATQRDHFKLERPQLSLRTKDITGALLNVQPQIVHFSGHGTPKGALCFENETGQTHLVQPDALAALFEQFANQVNCVLLNACYSETQAKAIAEHINCVIGMNKAIGDKAAIAFALGFYQALGAERTIEEAYKLGCVQIRLQGIPEHLTPVLIKKG